MADYQIVQHEGEKIHQLDIRDDGPDDEEEILDVIDEMKEGVSSQPKGSVLALTLVEGTNYNTTILEALKELTKDNKPYVKKSAIVGVDGLQKVAMQGVKKFSNREFEQFDTVEEAKDYLVE